MTETNTIADTQSICTEFEFGHCLISADLSVSTWNQVCARWGFFSDLLRGKQVEEAFAPLLTSRKSLNVFLDSIKAIQSGAEKTRTINLELKVLTSQVESFQVCLFSNSDNSGTEIIFRPIGQTDALSQIYQRVFDSTPDGIMILDANRQVRLVNEACGKLLGREPKDVVENNCVCGQMVSCHMSDGRSLNSQLCPARSLFTDGGVPQTETMLVLNSSGEERWVETTYNPLLDDQGRVEFVVGLIRDVHERKLLEERLRQSEKLASLGQLTAGIAHEIKNPLGIILSSVEIILDEKRPREMQTEAASFIRDEVKRLDERIREFLKFARPSNPQKEQIDLGKFVRDFFQNREPESRRPLTTLEIPEGLPNVLCDEDHLAQILTNLYINIFEASHNDAKIIVRLMRKGKNIYLEMHDDGPGVPEELRDTVFDPFFTTDAKGTGLGLSIVAQLATANGGSVKVEKSELLGGANFRVRVPVG